jgi:hypothetical protein
MKRFSFVWVLFVIAIMSGRAVNGAELIAHWPLEQSLENTVGRLRLDPYGEGKKLSERNANFKEGAIELGEITLFTPLDLDVADSITVTGWINPKEIEMGFSETAPHSLIFFYDSKNRKDTQFIFRILDGKLGAFNATPAKNIFSSFMAPPEEWSFFAFVLTKEAVDIYLNEYPPQTTPISNTFKYDRIFIGALSPDLMRPYRGLIKNVRLYKGALSAEEVGEVYKTESEK